ncbi:restriction endonuclease subunit S [Accumulibacter sp.]|uniref:restriction endonuclease subunit S n=1 Tax=Accumulibacter sp. TaxID=2053492 RepID=UPI0028C4B8FA|nr:restriction endonuclease subunit S [Accumulibacter sp.]
MSTAGRSNPMPLFPALPKDWKLKPLKRAVCFIEGPGIMAVDFESDGVPLLRIAGLGGRIVSLDGCNFLSPDLVEAKWSHFRVRNGDLLISGSASTGLCAEVDAVTVGAIPYTGIIIVRPKEEEADRDFFRWFFLSDAFATQVSLAQTGSALKHFGPTHLSQMFAPIPPVLQQRAIADYLDRETARLDALVAAKERVLGLLAEKRRALITRAVTRCLDPRAPLRDSGIPWLGEIPAAWEAERTRWLFRERDQRSATGEEELLTVSHLTGVTPRSEKDVNMFEAETTEGYKICLTGDLVVNTLWAWMGAMGVSPVDGIASPAYNVYEPGDRLEPSYVDALVRLPVFAQEVTRYSKGVWSSRLRLYPEGFFEVFLPVPSLSEQRAIVTYIAIETKKIDKLRIATERSTALLKERRSALIAAAVTGQIDVESAA